MSDAQVLMAVRSGAGWIGCSFRAVRHLLLVIVLAAVSACAALDPKPLTLADRLAMFPAEGVPVEKPVTVRWNESGVPWIAADTDRDCAFVLGLVHAHLRLTQMAVMRRIVEGRMSETAGPFMAELDRTMRTLELGYAAPAVVAKLPSATRQWLQSFVDGLNWYQGHVSARPPEYAMFGLKDETWSIADLVGIGRLSGVDVNWSIYLNLLKERQSPDWTQSWRRVLAAGTDSTPSFGVAGKTAMLRRILMGLGRSGSNAYVVGPQHSRSGAALLAADPHLTLTLPNVWMLVGLKSPSYRAVGMMVPGLPVFGLGRNEDVAWSGTNMRAAASDLIDIGQASDITERRERIVTRLWADEEITVRRAKDGPIVSDLAFFPGRPGETVALRWKGYEASDEFSAFLGVMRARSASDFRAAFASYGVGAMNMLCATRSGDICQVMAAHLPVRDATLPHDLVLKAGDPAAIWHGEVNAMDLPFALNPPSGLLATANNRPAPTPFTLGYFYPTSERVERIYDVLKSKDKLGLDDLAALQRDTMSLSAVALRDRLLPLLRPSGAAPEAVRGLEAWDGRYDGEASGPVLFESLLYTLATRLYGHGGKPPEAKSDWGYLVQYLPGDLAEAPDRAQIVAAALKDAAANAGRYPTWGDMHRMRVGHVLMMVPGVGGSFLIDDYGSGGSRNTVMKTAHGLVRDRHYASYGSQARQLCDMSDPDRCSFVLFGGEDGWLGSANFADQVALWRQGRAIDMPLTPARVEADFQHVITLKP